MGLITAIQNKTEQARAKERIRPLLESRMMRDILLEIGQRGTEKLDPQSVPLDQRPLASKRAAECGTAGLQQSVIREIVLDEAAITLFAGSDEVPFLYGDYNYEIHPNRLPDILTLFHVRLPDMPGHYLQGRSHLPCHRHTPGLLKNMAAICG